VRPYGVATLAPTVQYGCGGALIIETDNRGPHGIRAVHLNNRIARVAGGVRLRAASSGSGHTILAR